NIYRLFDTSFLACGIYQPKRANIVSMNNEEGYHSSKEYAGFIDDIKNIDEYSEDKIVITGEIKLFEDKRYNNAGEEISFLQNEFLSFKTRLVDNLDYSLTIILSDSMVAKITTKYKDYREVSSSRKLPFGFKNLGDKSSRDCFLPFPKINGEYEGIIEEYYMRSTDGTKLLHYATHSPYLCLFDIPTDFDFVNNNKALEETPSVYDIRNYNPEDPNLQNVRPMIDKAIKQLKLTGKN
ncbi:MAG: hypothetical protein K2G03_00555, partial [Bacilli bacterium]|nr:hypothetical protein [Bacilli bacterium]